MSNTDVVLWLREEIAQLERRLEAMRALLALLEQQELTLPLRERVEEVKVNRKRIARVMTGENYVRLAFNEPVRLPQEIREYLGTIEQELHVLQARTGEVQAKVRYSEMDGGVVEIRFEQLYSTVEMLKARAALKYVAEAVYHHKAKPGGSDGYGRA